MPVESIRFAAANRLCIELGYGGTKRLIEPYALRRTKAGHLLLCATRLETRESRSYRVDRIESITVTNRTFTPLYQVEITSSGVLQAPTLSRPPKPRSGRPIRGDRPPRVVYVIRCPACGKEFKRRRLDNRLKPHPGPGGWPCHATTGYSVRTFYE